MKPYFGLRSYTDAGEHYGGQIGSEATPAEWLAALVECTREWVRVLKPEGSIFINLGDKYAQDDERSRNGLGARSTGLASGAVISGETIKLGRKDNGGIPRKSLLGLPWRYALAATDQLGLILRRDIIWAKPNGLPESVTDRCRSSHEYVFHLVKQPRYYAAVDEIREQYSDNPRAAWNRANGFAQTTPHASDGHNSTIRGRNGHRDAYENPLGKLPGSVWNIPSHPLTVPPHVGVDHFAAFPVELPRRIVLGWSPPGVCVACGQGRRPVVDSRNVHAPGAGPTIGTKYAATNGAPSQLGRRTAMPMRTEATITGYVCACPQPDAPTRPSVVLDPFCGTGTTLLAADAYGRHAIGLDRSADYCRLARWRTSDRGERAKAMQVPKPPPVADGQDALFAI